MKQHWLVVELRIREIEAQLREVTHWAGGFRNKHERAIGAQWPLNKFVGIKNFRGVNFTGADLLGVHLCGADLRGAKFTTEILTCMTLQDVACDDEQLPWLVLHPAFSRRLPDAADE